LIRCFDAVGCITGWACCLYLQILLFGVLTLNTEYFWITRRLKEKISWYCSCSCCYFAPGRGAKYCDKHDCLSVCLAYLKDHTSKHPPLTTMQYDISFVFWGMTSCLPIIRQAEAMPVWCLLKVTHKWSAPRAQSDVYYCLVYGRPI